MKKNNNLKIDINSAKQGIILATILGEPKAKQNIEKKLNTNNNKQK